MMRGPSNNLWPTPRTRSPLGAAATLSPRLGFTLVEMVVVIAIVLMILGVALPAASALWNDRKVAAAEGTIQGLLMTTRARAMQADGAETGFLAFVDREGAQRLVSIAQVDPIARMDRAALAMLPPAQVRVLRRAYQNVFEITANRDDALPVPMRVVPRYVVEQPVGSSDPTTFDEAELANADFEVLPANGNQAQRHRNFFTMIFSTEGQLVVRRDVLIQDADLIERSQGGAGRGDRTGLLVGPGPPAAVATTTEYYEADTDDPMPIDPTNLQIPFLVRDDPGSDVAINFPAVDGLLVYDDSLFNGLSTAAQKREYMRRAARPLYVNRWTGAIIRGPVGENTTP